MAFNNPNNLALNPFAAAAAVTFGSNELKEQLRKTDSFRKQRERAEAIEVEIEDMFFKKTQTAEESNGSTFIA